MAIISEAPINPKYVYIQATEPADKTEGKLWYNTTSNILYTSDGTNYVEIVTDLTALQNINLEQDLQILINSIAATSSLNDYDDMYVDIFIDSDGADDTIDTGNTTALFHLDSYYNDVLISDTFTRTNSATVGDAEIGGTWAETETGGTAEILDGELKIINTDANEVHCVQSFTATDGISRIDFKMKTSDVTTTGGLTCWLLSGASAGINIGIINSEVAYYDGIWNKIIDAVNDTEYNISLRNIDFTADTYDIWINGVEEVVGADFQNAIANVDSLKFRTFQANGTSTYFDNVVVHSVGANKIIQTNVQTITANPIAHQVYCHNSVAGSGSITYDISFDNGVTWVTGQAVNTKNTSVHAGTQMIKKLNLNGVGAGNTAAVEDYGVMLFY